MPKLWLILALLTLSLPVRAESTFTFANTPGKLPKDIQPEHYTIALTPDLKTKTFTGSETVKLKVSRRRTTVLLNTLGLTITQATLGRQTAQVSYDTKAQVTTLTFAKSLSPGTHTLQVAFNGKIERQSQGLYFENYTGPRGEQTMLATQMEPTDARRMFPGWDEPVFRASYQLSVVVPQDFLAVSNTPVVREQTLAAGTKLVTFGSTPKMSSYLVALIAGDLEALEGEAAGVKIRVITTRGKKEKGRYALEAAQKLLVYYNDYFGVPYPLPKLDMIAIPGGFSGAMENWGAITYNEAGLLFDPQRSNQATREAIFAVVAHEMAHQWFGNLVTMAWWDNLWLNEGFASWMGTKATDYFNPTWQVWLRVSDRTMETDSRASTHPVQQPITNEAQANNAFDEITYQKGQAFLRMLEAYLGEKPFQRGIRRYMQTHRYSNTTTADLWAALSATSGQPVNTIAAQWIEQPGFPLVKAKSTCINQTQVLTLTQERFTVNYPSAPPLTWPIPITLKDQTFLLNQSSAQLPTKVPCDQPIKLNYGDVGYYRVQADPIADPMTLGPADRLNLLSDSWALVEAGRAPISTYLDLIEKVKTSPELAIWEQIGHQLLFLDRLRPSQPAFRAYARSLLKPVFAQLGWTVRPSEGLNATQLRDYMVDLLGFFQDPAIVEESQRRFQTFRQNPTSLDPSLKKAVLNNVGRFADPTTYEQLRTLGQQTTSTEEKRRFYGALEGARDPALAQITLGISLTEELAPNRALALVPNVGVTHPELAWTFAQAHLPALQAKLTAFRRSTYLPNIWSNFSEAPRAAEFAAFAQARLPSDDQNSVQKALEIIRIKALLTARELPILDRWVSAH